MVVEWFIGQVWLAVRGDWVGGGGGLSCGLEVDKGFTDFASFTECDF